MNSISQEPLTPGQWLRRSVGWTTACLAGVWLFRTVLLQMGHSHQAGSSNQFGILVFGSCCVAHYLIWRRALPGSTAAFEHEVYRNTFSWTVLAAGLWRAALFLFQVGCFLLLLLLAVLVVTDADIAPHFG